MIFNPAIEQLATAREKTVFRPVLPGGFMSGITEMQMSKSYFEKLKDPRWQKKRLEALERSSWSCESCGDSENTLHVHHKQYFKGREPWEYEVGQLAVLCENCHKFQHDDDGNEDKLLLAISFLPLSGPRDRDCTASLIAGFAGYGMDNKYVSDPESYLLGVLARLIDGDSDVDAIQFQGWDDLSKQQTADRPYLSLGELDELVSLATHKRPELIDGLRQLLKNQKT
jgi:hypothetical protein